MPREGTCLLMLFSCVSKIVKEVSVSLQREVECPLSVLCGDSAGHAGSYRCYVWWIGRYTREARMQFEGQL